MYTNTGTLSQTNKQTEKLTDMQTYKHTAIRTDKHATIQIDNTQTHKHINKRTHTDRQTHGETVTVSLHLCLTQVPVSCCDFINEDTYKALEEDEHSDVNKADEAGAELCLTTTDPKYTRTTVSAHVL